MGEKVNGQPVSMKPAQIRCRAFRLLPWLLALYAGASFLHFTHNAEYLTQYPNLPAAWTRADVYLAWCCVTAVGLVGTMLYRGGLPRAGLTLLSIYGALGFDALLHYTRAPVAHHSAAMNFTIWLEVGAAAVLLLNLAALPHCAKNSLPGVPPDRWSDRQHL